MWAASLTPIGPYFPIPIPKPTKHQPLTHFPFNVSGNSGLRRQPATANGGGNPNQEEGKVPISGSDILWALQRAAAKKKKANSKKKKGSASSSDSDSDSDSDASRREKDGIDYSKVRPLQIKAEWSLKLDELEKRLKELEDTT